MASRGRFITFEGPDGSGKSTQARLLAEMLRSRGVEVLLTREPGGTALGERVRHVLLDTGRDEVHNARTDALLFQAARAQHVDQVIAPALDRGLLVISDRYADSSVAYQGYGSEIPIERIRALGAFATRGIRPDLTILLDLPVRVGLARRASGDPDGITRFESADTFDVGFHERVRAGYLELARAEPHRWRVVEADRDEAEIERDVRAIVEEFLDLTRTPAG